MSSEYFNIHPRSFRVPSQHLGQPRTNLGRTCIRRLASQRVLVKHANSSLPNLQGLPFENQAFKCKREAPSWTTKITRRIRRVVIFLTPRNQLPPR